MSTRNPQHRGDPHEGYITVGDATLYYREIGEDQPIIILHGGPDFDHSYLLPDLDHLADAFRLIYYAQRGRGKSGDNVQPQDVSLQSEMADIERVRANFSLDSTVILGHSWGGLLAMEYAIRHPDRVSHLILMNTGPASHDDYQMFRQERIKNLGADLERMKALMSSATYTEGDLDTDAAYHRIHFGSTLRQPEHLEQVISSLRLNFTNGGIVKAREIEARLLSETWLREEYDLFPQLSQFSMPALVIHGEYDLVPVDCAARIADTIPGARFALLKNCGHFTYIESPDHVRREICDFLGA